MRNPIQFTPAFIAALLCSAVWFVFWLTAFHPVIFHVSQNPVRPDLIHPSRMNPVFSRLRNPSLFALPSVDGFSGAFPEHRVDLRLDLEKPVKPSSFLPQADIASPKINLEQLLTGTDLQQSALPVPRTSPAPLLQPESEKTLLFFSPELETRIDGIPSLDLPGHQLPLTVRARLTIDTDGTIQSVFFEPPVTNTALPGAIRQIRFKPSGQLTEGWLDIRFPQPQETP